MGVRAGGEKTVRHVWTAACQTQVLNRTIFDALQHPKPGILQLRLNRRGAQEEHTYLFSNTIVSESSWTSLI